MYSLKLSKIIFPGNFSSIDNRVFHVDNE
ncbi:hypothetical protein YPPY03_0986, partial [Yersinia pestis PY-03]